MLYNYIRVFYGANGTLTDLSIDNQDETSSIPAEMVSSQDYIYIAQHFPFNNFFVQMNTPNTTLSKMTIQYWSGTSNQWQNAVDILDGTLQAGKSFARSGVVQFTPNPSFNWQSVGDNYSSSAPAALNTLNVYNVFWIRILVSSDLSAGTDIKRIAYAFSRSQQIDNLDVTINDFLESFKPGKTDWDDEIVTASIQLANDFKGRGLVLHQGEILLFDDVSMACDYKTLQLIYKNLGPAYKDKLDATYKDYSMAVNIRRFNFDKNVNARLERSEISNSVIRLQR